MEPNREGLKRAKDGGKGGSLTSRAATHAFSAGGRAVPGTAGDAGTPTEKTQKILQGEMGRLIIQPVQGVRGED